METPLLPICISQKAVVFPRRHLCGRLTLRFCCFPEHLGPIYVDVVCYTYDAVKVRVALATISVLSHALCGGKVIP